MKALQATEKERITIRIDKSIIAQFKVKAETTGGNYQSLINEVLKQYLLGESLQDVVRRTIQQELQIKQ
ncbi:conserved protein of unknown function [Candidatus Nitrosacidococcus tergens]|uniref:Uncharacterized protein n=1 Tax=Candidatus Nitrosacidococcus tergens TaxID=553981 RepID=A0A7G1Q9H9_9GAMM|nr:BrnA antitoxin family protein [Candidatus Nitrosacidococcus tergens]CAB1275748.1 conserved protein of unknown function [Candidatus Nitrosacidococcus tergens]